MPEMPAFDRISSRLPLSGSALVDDADVIVDADEGFLALVSLARERVLGQPLAEFLDVAGEGVPYAQLRGTSSPKGVFASAMGDGRRIVVSEAPAAIGNTWANKRLRRGQQRLEILLAASTGFARASTESEVAELLSEVAKRSYAATQVTVHLKLDGRFELAAGENPLLPHWPETYQPTGARTLLGRETLIVRSPEDVLRFVPDAPMDEVFRAAGIHAALSSPIMYEDTALGSMICFFDHPREFDDEAAPLAEALTTQAAQALYRIRIEETNRRKAMLDAVTGLPSRRLFETEIHRVLTEREDALCVIFIDLDRFKAVNDVLGHAAGDGVLQEVGRRLKGIVRKPDAVGRFGGDEFVVVAAVDGQHGAQAFAERILSALAEPYAGLPPELTIGASLGVVVVDGSHDLIPDRLIRAADHEMYAAKAAGGGTIRVAVLG